MDKFLMVGLGGALGAVGRYAISMLPSKSAFPFLTLLTNMLGALAIGFIAGLSSRSVMAEKWTLFWKTGVCGGFTTFSTFSLEAWGLLEQKNFIGAGVYVLLSVVLCIAGAVLGQYIGCRFARP